MRDGRIVEVMEVVGVEGSRVLFERYLPLHDTVLKRYRVAIRRALRRSGQDGPERTDPVVQAIVGTLHPSDPGRHGLPLGDRLRRIVRLERSC